MDRERCGERMQTAYQGWEGCIGRQESCRGRQKAWVARNGTQGCSGVEKSPGRCSSHLAISWASQCSSEKSHFLVSTMSTSSSLASFNMDRTHPSYSLNFLKFNKALVWRKGSQ